MLNRLYYWAFGIIYLYSGAPGKFREMAAIPGQQWPFFDTCEYFRRGCRFRRKGQAPEKEALTATGFADERIHAVNG
jgi:hypothetical protein